VASDVIVSIKRLLTETTTLLATKTPNPLNVQSLFDMNNIKKCKLNFITVYQNGSKKGESGEPARGVPKSSEPRGQGVWQTRGSIYATMRKKHQLL
jgi:hypothetical protein